GHHQEVTMAPGLFARRLYARFVDKLNRKARRSRPDRRQPLWLERLEDRFTPASVQWTGAAGTTSWTDKNNWSTGAIPGASDDVTIGIPVSGPISITTGTQSVHSLTDTTASLSITGGSLELAAASTVSQGFSVANGTLTVDTSLGVGAFSQS